MRSGIAGVAVLAAAALLSFAGASAALAGDGLLGSSGLPLVEVGPGGIPGPTGPGPLDSLELPASVIVDGAAAATAGAGEAAMPINEPAVRELATSAANALQPAAGAVTPAVEKTAAPILEPVPDGLVPAVEDVVAPLLRPMPDAVAPVLDAVVAPLSPITRPIADALAPILDPVAGALDPLEPPLPPLVNPPMDPILEPVPPLTGDAGPGPVLPPIVPPTGELPGPDPIPAPWPPSPNLPFVPAGHVPADAARVDAGPPSPPVSVTAPDGGAAPGRGLPPGSAAAASYQVDRPVHGSANEDGPSLIPRALAFVNATGSSIAAAGSGGSAVSGLLVSALVALSLVARWRRINLLALLRAPVSFAPPIPPG